ncbi:MAG: right-handed parallel beta-helix repeat-containing protein [Blastocatellia bacterium]|nr:right-handed parallel beta-helix repeat-containing protein [Blastocatellia bacterium]
MKKNLWLPISLLAIVLLIVQSLIPIITTARAETERAISKTAPTPLASLSDEIALRAARRGNPWINLTDGRELLTAYTGDQHAAWALESNQAQGLSLASDDFDEDGTQDLVCGYRAADGTGILTLHRGNVDSIFPNTPEAQLRRNRGEFTDAPFLSPARVFEMPVAAEFLGAGDFDADGHRDVVAASSTSEALYLLKGDGQGGLGEAEIIQLPGRVTALTVGDVNRADSFADVVVGVNGEYGPQALVFQNFDGALRNEPETIILAAEARSFAIGQLDDSYEYDLAIAAGSELLIVKGRNRLMGVAEPATMSRRDFPFKISAIAIGEFMWEGEHASDIAVMSEDGRVQYLRRDSGRGENLQSAIRNLHSEGEEWEVMNEARVAEVAPQGERAGRRVMAKVKVSSHATDDLVVMEGASNQMRIVSGGPGSRQPLHEVTGLDVSGEAVAVLPMRLNRDGLSDLVMLRSDGGGLSMAMTAPMSTFTVTGANNSGPGSLRQAILDANAVPGLDAIHFNLTFGSRTITPQTALPEITESVTIDGTTQPGFAGKPLIELSGNVTARAHGLDIRGGATVVRGLVINKFFGDGIVVNTKGGNRVEGCFIGTNVSGTAALGNTTGVEIDDAPSNTIGGTEAAAGNLISGNGVPNILIFGNSARDNQVQGNKVGTDFNGKSELSGNRAGVGIVAPNNTVGGSTSGAGNLISGNVIGIILGLLTFGDDDIVSTTGNQIMGNRIGTDMSGVAPLPNSEEVHCRPSVSHNLITLNTIAFNKRGVFGEASSTDNFITVNSIHSNKELGIDLFPNPGVTDNDGPGDPDSGANTLQNFPMLVETRDDNGTCVIKGVLESKPSTKFRIEFFANREPDPSGHGEGETSIGAIDVTTDPQGRAEFDFPAPQGAGPYFSSTATDPEGNTSEFSGKIGRCPTSTVTTTAPGGDGSLAEAIPEGGYIVFNIPTTDPGYDPATNTWTMSPQTPLPNVSVPGTAIDGKTQPGFKDKPVIVIDGSRLSGFSSNGFHITADNCIIAGISIVGFPGNGIFITDPATRAYIYCCLLGVHPSGEAMGNGLFGAAVTNSSNNTFSGNTISANRRGGFLAEEPGSSGNLIINNKIGTDCTGTVAMGNQGAGVGLFDAPGNYVSGNLIGANSGDGAVIGGSGATDNIFSENQFGSNFETFDGVVSPSSLNAVRGLLDLGNLGAGIRVEFGATGNQIRDNLFAFNRLAAIAAKSATGNEFRGNRMFSNALGIDLNSDGPTANDSGDADGGANNGQNYPELTSASQTNSTAIRGALNSRPNTSYILEFYSSSACNGSGFGEGEYLIGTDVVTTDGSGNAEIDVTLEVTVPTGQKITATATDPDGNTSEFSRCLEVTGTGRADIALSMSGPANISAGQTITYTIEAKNEGQASALEARVTDEMPACLTEIFCDVSQGRSTVVGNRVIADLGIINPGEAVTMTITATVTEGCEAGFSNTARVVALSDTNATNDTATASTGIGPPVPQPQITKLKKKGTSKVIVTGENFQSGAKICVIKGNGAEVEANKTKFKGAMKLKGTGVSLEPGDRVVVKNPDGGRSGEFLFTG